MRTFFRQVSLVIFLGLALIAGCFRIGQAQADYDPNNLIRDDLFIDSTSMDQPGIQAFLSAHDSCLASVDPSLLNSSGQSASTIIYQAAINSKYPISPKVILTTMQKEWGLLTLSCAQQDARMSALGLPAHAYLNEAVGYDVPDVLGIGTCLYTFNSQLLGNICNDGTGSYSYLGGPEAMRKNWNVGSGPSGTTFPSSFTVQQCSVQQNVSGTPCGASDWGKQITITPATKATSLLYRYTPYAYFGNYNFWQYYNQFFPPAPYASQYISQSNVPPILQGQSDTVTLRIENRGYVTWLNSGPNPVRIATASPNDRTSAFADASWLAISAAGNRAANLTSTEAGDSSESIDVGKVKPGQIGVFTFTFTAKNNQPAGTYREFLSPILDGMPGAIDLGGIYFDVTVIAQYNASLSNQSAYPTIPSTQYGSVTFQYQNTGASTWYNSGSNPITLDTAHPFGRNSIFIADDWISGSQAVSFSSTLAGSSSASIVPGQVQPGQIGVFVVNFKAHAWIAPGFYNEYFTLSQDGTNGYGAFGPDGVYVRIGVTPYWSAQLYSQSSYPVIGSGQYGSVTFQYQNTGGSTWYNTGANPVMIDTSHPTGRGSIFIADDWLSGSQTVSFSSTLAGSGSQTITPGQVQPGQIGVFVVNFKAHAWIAPGFYNEYFNISQDGNGGIGQFGPDGVYVRVNIVPAWSAQLYSQTAYPTIPSTQYGSTTFEYQNTGSSTWYNSGTTPINLVTSHPFGRNSIFIADDWLSGNRAATFSSTLPGLTGSQTITPGQVQPGQIGVFVVNFKAHAWIAPGFYNEYFTLSQDGTNGYGAFGPDGVYVHIHVTP